MNKAVLLLDGSDSMNASHELHPTRLLALRPVIRQLVVNYLSQSALAVLSTVVLRDGVAHRLMPLSSDIDAHLEALEQRYFLYGGSGNVSLENGLKVSFAELQNRARYDKQAGHIMVITALLSTVDPEDVLKTIDTLGSKRIRCDVVSLVGAPHILQHLVQVTGGELCCPMSRGEVASTVLRLGELPPAPAGSQGLGQHHQGQQGQESAEELVPVGFPDANGRCPQCAALLQNTIPTTCSVCGLLITTESQLVWASLQQNPPQMVRAPPPPAVQAKEIDTAWKCTGCGCDLQFEGELTKFELPIDGTPGIGSGRWQCELCRSLFCDSCGSHVKESLLICPGCF